MDNLGIVLSGGGVKGVAHIGFLQALREHGIVPKYIAGTSAGALVASLYAAGYSAKEMVEFFKATPLISWYFYSTSKPGLLDSEKYRGYFEKYFPQNNFEELNQQVFITTTDIEKGESVIHKSGALIDALIASCCVPLVFTPVKIDGVFHSDGGIMNNFPVEPLVDLGLSHILGSYVCSVEPTDQKKLNTSIKVMSRAFDLSQEALCRHKFDLCDYVIAPKELSKIGFLDTKGIHEAYEIGYQQTMENIDFIFKTLLLDGPLQAAPLVPAVKYEGAEKRKKHPTQKSNANFSYFDIWPLNWAFGKQEDENAKV